MNYTVLKRVPEVEEVSQKFPIDALMQELILKHRQDIKNILNGKDNRLLVIVGPCSAWPNDAVLTYAEKLHALSLKLQKHLKLVMRVYVQKPRTTKGWSGSLTQPDPYNLPDISAGIMYARKMMLDVTRMGLPIADEALFLNHSKYFLELLSWVAIGARSSENPAHRIFASSLDFAVGLKNPTHGALAIAVNSVFSAQQQHVSVIENHEIRTHGNPYAHLVLRGGNFQPNFSKENLLEIKKYFNLHGVINPSVIIDASHDNCIVEGKKNYLFQRDVVLSVLKSLKENENLRMLVKGIMLESFIKEGHQKLDERTSETLDRTGLSITDPCLSWETTEELLTELAQQHITEP